MADVSPFDLDDFSGGLTDFVYHKDLTKSVILDNFEITLDKHILTRPGSYFDVGNIESETLLLENLEILLTESSEELQTETVDLDTNAQIPSGATRISTLISYDSNTLLVQAAGNIYYRGIGVYETVNGPLASQALLLASTGSNISYSIWNKQVLITHDSETDADDGPAQPVKIYRDENGTLQSRNAGLPKMTSNPSIAGGAGANNYIYAFTRSFQYQVDDQIFIDESAPIFVSKNSILEPSASTVNITTIPSISAGTQNLDAAVIKVNIYRTVNNGDIFYRVVQQTNGLTTYNDTMSDATLQSTGVQLYTNDGSFAKDEPPKCSLLHVVNGIGYYGYIQEGAEVFPSLIRQSIPDDVDGVPLDFEDEVEDTITGISSVQGIPVILCTNHIYRLDGSLDRYGRGYIKHTRISDVAGCLSNLSCVQAEGWLFWAGNDGFYATDGFKAIKVSDDINDLYANFVAIMEDPKKIQGTYDEIHRRIYWTVKDDDGKLENNALFCLNLRYGVTSNCVFNTWHGDTFYASAIAFHAKQIHRADHKGYVYFHDASYTSDLKLESGASPSLWVKETVMWKWRSVAMNFGSMFARKWVTRALLTAKNQTNVSIQITAINDDSKSERLLHPIRWRKNFTWGDPDFFWGNPDCVWSGEGLIEQWRWMPAKSLRLSYLQLNIQNAKVNIINSDLMGTAFLDGAANQATLNTVGMTWPTNSVNYFLTVEDDSYTREYEILSRSDTVLTVDNSSGALPTGNYKWQIKGYPKDEVLNLLGMDLHVGVITPTQLTFESGQDGGNA